MLIWTAIHDATTNSTYSTNSSNSSKLELQIVLIVLKVQIVLIVLFSRPILEGFMITLKDNQQNSLSPSLSIIEDILDSLLI